MMKRNLPISPFIKGVLLYGYTKRFRKFLLCQISEKYRREAFYTGMSVGFHLRGELCN